MKQTQNVPIFMRFKDGGGGGLNLLTKIMTPPKTFSCGYHFEEEKSRKHHLRPLFFYLFVT